MKHHCHCGFREHFKSIRVKKLGLAGGIFLVLHLLFHVVECLILPSILVGLGGHLAEESAAATNGEPVIIESSAETEECWHYEFIKTSISPLDNTDFYQISP